MNTARACGLVVFKCKLILIYEEKRKKKAGWGEGPPRDDNASFAGGHGKGGRGERGSGRQKRIMDTMFDEACSNSRKVGACTRPDETSKRLCRVDVYLLSATSETSSSSSTSNSIYHYRKEIDYFLVKIVPALSSFFRPSLFFLSKSCLTD